MYLCYRYKNDDQIEIDDKKYILKSKHLDYIDFKIKSLTLEDTANYTIVANNGFLSKNLTFDRRVISKYTILFVSYRDYICISAIINARLAKIM